MVKKATYWVKKVQETFCDVFNRRTLILCALTINFGQLFGLFQVSVRLPLTVQSQLIHLSSSFIVNKKKSSE